MPIDGMTKVLDYLKAQGFKVRATKDARKQATGKGSGAVAVFARAGRCARSVISGNDGVYAAHGQGG